MAVKLWTVHFMRICVANLLLFISLYVLFPVLPIEMSERLGLPVTETGVIFLFSRWECSLSVLSMPIW